MRGSGWIIAALALCVGAAQPQKVRNGDRNDAADKAAFETVCGACHPSSMASDLRSELEWKDTVDLMINAGAKATPEQFDGLMRYLLHNLTKVNVNTGTAAEIAPVLDVSEATAQAIVKRRAEKGSFRNIEELKKLPGVNAARLDERKDRIVF
jgi:competence protein ComEA